MALALCISAPYFKSYRHPLGLGLIFPRCSCRVNLRCSSGRGGIRCSAADHAGETSGQGSARNSAAASHSPSWAHVEPAKDAYAGWAPLESDDDADRRPGFLKIGAGVVLAIAFSAVTYIVYSRQGTKHAVVNLVTTQQQQQKKQQQHQDDGPSRSSPDESQDAHKALTPETSSTPSSNESKKEVHGENPEPEVASASDLHQKKTAPGQDSFPSKDVTEFSDDEESALSTESPTDSDIESDNEKDPKDSEKVDSKATSSAVERAEPTSDGPNPTNDVKENDALSTDEKTIVVSSATPLPDSDLAADKSDVHEPPTEPKSEVNVLDQHDKEQFGDISLGNAGSTESYRGPEESNSATAKHEASPSTESKEETMLTVSASLVVPKGAAEDVLDFLGLDTESKVDELDLSALETGLVNNSPSVLETLSSSLGSEFWHSESVEYFGIPAPSSPSAAAQARPGSVVVPATVDHEQEQALAALQALKVIEPDVEAGGICTRREYARWLIAMTGTLARSPAQKVFPAMYIESVSELAFNDVVPEDPDFPYIQGLAEAGLISSNLSRHDANENGRSTDGAIFLPDSPLSRQDLVSWKVALEGHKIQAIDKQKLKAQTGYIDIDRINEDALPFLAVDLAAGERSVISTAFGYTRRFQPGKPVTRAQAAMALVTGEAADMVGEELTRLEADDIAEAAVVAELALEARARKHVDEYFDTELKLEKDLRVSVEKQLEDVKDELKGAVKEREDQRVLLESVQAAVQAERDLLHRFRSDVEEQLQALTTNRVEVSIEKDRLETLRREAEEGGRALAENKAEVEVEKKALLLARLWAEDEAKKARSHAKVLEEVRKRWQGRGIEVRVDKELDDENIPALSWQYSGQKTELNKFLQRPPVQDVLTQAGDLKSRVVERLVQLLEVLKRALMTARQKIAELFQVVREKGGESLRVVREKGGESLRVAGGKAHILQQDTFSVASRKAQEVQSATSRKAQEMQSVTSRKAQEVQSATSSMAQEVQSATSRKAQEVQSATWSTAEGVSSSVAEGTRKFADGFRGEAQKFAGKFKSS